MKTFFMVKPDVAYNHIGPLLSAMVVLIIEDVPYSINKLGPPHTSELFEKIEFLKTIFEEPE